MKKKLVKKTTKTRAATAPTKAPDTKKRLFLKLLGIAGLGFVGSLLTPKRADALVFGSTPTSNVVGVKNNSNARVNPATEETVATLATQTTAAAIKTNTDNLASIKTGTDNLATVKTNTDTLVTAGGGGYVRQDSTATIAKETGGNLATIATNTANIANLTFDAGALVTTSSGGGSASAVGIKDALDNRITPVQDDSVILLRRIVKLMESQAVVDTANRQRITLDSLGTATAITTTVPVSGSLTTAGTVSTVSTVSAITTLLGQNQQMFQDVARDAYANGIRQNLTFS